MAVKKLYFAPMEGVAGYIFRNIYVDFFDDADKFFSPFVVTRPSGIMKNKELRDILPENNEKLFLVPHAEPARKAVFFQKSGLRSRDISPAFHVWKVWKCPCFLRKATS